MVDTLRIVGTRLLAGLLAICCLVNSAQAVGMRDDLPGVQANDSSNPYVDFGSIFDSVVRLSWETRRGTFYGTGTLVGSTDNDFKILTAAHNVDGTSGAARPDGIIDADFYTVEFGDSTSSITHAVEIGKSNVALNPKWYTGDPYGSGLDPGAGQFDVAVLRFDSSDFTTGSSSSLPEPYRVSDKVPLDDTGILVGYGRTGVGSDFAGDISNNRLAGANVIDAADSLSGAPNDGFTLRADFDSPDLLTSIPGYDGPIANLEATSARGDSGGPLLLPNYTYPTVVGVLHGGYNDVGGISEYGDVSVWASTSDEINKAFLQANGVAFFGSDVASNSAAFAVPEPNSTLMLMVGMLGLLRLRQPRR